MEHKKLDALMTPVERIARVAAAGLAFATSSSTKSSGAKSYDNADGTRTIIGNVANDESNPSYTMATHVGDTTAPGTPTGITASSKSGVVVVEWDGTLTGGIPDDFFAVRVYLDGSELGILTGAGSVSSASLEGGTTHSVTATAEDDACLPDGTPTHNVSEPTAAISVTVTEGAESVAVIAQEALGVANATGQHFFADTGGIHVTEVTQEAWQQVASGKNILINSAGFLLRNAETWLAQFTSSAVAFYDGLGNTTSHVIASFGADGAQIGADGTRHAVIDSDGLTVYNANGTIAPVNATVDGGNILDASITGGKIVGSTLTGIPYAAIEDADIEVARIADTEISRATISQAQVENLSADYAHITNGAIDNASIGYARVDGLDANYAQVGLANVSNAWIDNGVVRDGAITNAMINSVSANKLTAGTIDASNITVTNLNADNITTGTINGQRIGEGSLSLNKLSEDVYTEAEVDSIVDGLNDRIDGAIETHTGTAVPTLNNTPASAWNTTALRDEHVGDVYYVVNSQSQQNGYCYRFTKSGSTYSWQLIKDSDVTAALSRLTTAEGKITSIELFDSTVSSFMTNTDDELTSVKSRATSLETRMTDAEGDISDKVDTSTFNTLSQTVDTNTANITSLSSAVSQKADGSTVTALTNRVSTVEQDVDGIETSIGELQTTVSEKADSSTVTTVSNRLNTVSDTVDGHTQSITSLQSTVSQKADGSTVSTLSSKVNTIEDTVDGHTSQLTSITSTQTTMQSTLDKTVKSSIQLWYSKANTTAPNKPTSQVTSTSTAGNAWRIVVPAYNASYPNYYYCWQYEYTDGTYGWSAVVRDIAMGESQATARTADSNATAAVTTANTASTNASTALTTANTANTNASEAKTTATTASTTASEAKTTAETAASDASTAKTNAASAVSTANSASTTATNAQSTANANIKSSVQLWFTKANSTAPNKPTSVVSTSNANTANAWNLVVPVWNSSYPHYYYCYQQQKGDGTYQWTDVVYDRATSEAQQLANTTSTNLSTLQTNYATFKQQTEQFESTVGSRLTTIESDIDGVEERVSDNETSISNNASAIALKANSSDVYTKTDVDGKITQEVSDRNAAITAKANEITSSVSETYATKTAVNGKADASDVTALAGRVTTAESNITQNASEIALRATKTETYQSAQPNLAPLGTVDFSDVYSATTNPDGYWRATLTTWFTRLDDGWVRVYKDNTSGTSAVNTTAWRPSPSPSVVAGRAYTILTEIRNNNSSGSSQTDMYLQQIANNQFWGDINGTTIDDEHVTTTTNISLRTCGETYERYSYRIADTEHLTTVPIEMFRYNFRLPAGGKFDFEFRQSVYEGIYDGPYKPYSGTQLYASQAELKVTNDSISTKVDKDGVISSINQSAESVTINAGKINLVGAVTIGDLASATQDAVLNSNVQVGGRNLLTGTGDWSHCTISSDSGSASGDTFTFSAHSSLSWYSVSFSNPHMPFSDVDGKTLTLSFDYRSDDFSDTSGDHYIWINAAASATENGSRSKYRQISTSTFNGVFVPTTEWQRGTITFDVSQGLFTAGSGEINYFYIQFYNHTLNSLQLRHVKLEQGNVATDWTPAPEDVDAAVSDAAKTATNYITQVDQNGITIHPSGGTSNRAEIDADGMEVYKGDVSVASYGDTARIGAEDAAHINISSDSVIIDSGGTTSPVIMTTSNGYSHIQADYIDALQYLSSFDGLSSNWLNIGGTQTIAGVNFGFSSATTNSNGITTFNPDLGTTPTAVFVAAGKASSETEAVAKIAVPMVWSIDSATQVQVRWQRSDTNAWLASNAVGWYWLALA